MKVKFTLVILCLFVCQIAQSQFSKGDKLVGGNIAFNNSSGSIYQMNSVLSSNSTIGNLRPRFSWVTGNHTMQGIMLQGGYNRNKIENASGVNAITSYNAGAGYFLRNFHNITDQFGWYLEYLGTAGYYWQRSSGYSSDTNLGVSTGVAPGVFFLVGKNVSLEAGFGGLYANYHTALGQQYKSNGFSIGLNFPSNFSFGMQFLLNKK